jgi:ribosomal subunit interface protein
MPAVVELSFNNMEHSDAVEARVHERVRRLEKIHDRLTSCRVVIEAPHRRQHKGQQYRVRITLGLAQGQVAVSRDPGDDFAHTDIYVAIRDSFDAAERRLKEHMDRLQGEVKARMPPRPADTTA